MQHESTDTLIIQPMAMPRVERANSFRLRRGSKAISPPSPTETQYSPTLARRKAPSRLASEHQELLESARYYHYQLQLFNMRYIAPLGTILPSHVHKFIFCGLENIINVTATFIHQLCNVIGKVEHDQLNDVLAKDIIKIFEQVGPEMRATYTPYMMNFKFASEVIETLTKERTVVSELLTATEEELVKEQERTTNIASFMILPVQYKPRLLLLLSEIIKRSAHLHDDTKAALNEVKNELSRSIDEINDEVRARDTTVGAVRRLCNGSVDLMCKYLTPTRSIMREEIDNGVTTTHEGVMSKCDLYLFDDLLVIVVLSEQYGIEKIGHVGLKYGSRCLTTGLTIIDSNVIKLDDTSLSVSSSVDNFMQNWILSFHDNNSQQMLFLSINMCIQQRLRKRSSMIARRASNVTLSDSKRHSSSKKEMTRDNSISIKESGCAVSNTDIQFIHELLESTRWDQLDSKTAISQEEYNLTIVDQNIQTRTNLLPQRLYKYTSVLECSLQELETILSNAKIRAQLDGNLLMSAPMNYHLSFDSTENTVVTKESCSLWPLKPRDFVVANTVVRVDEKTTIIVRKSITHPAAPETSAFTRGTKFGGWILEAESKTKTKCTKISYKNMLGSKGEMLVLNCAAKNRVKSMHKKLCNYVDDYKQVKQFA